MFTVSTVPAIRNLRRCRDRVEHEAVGRLVRRRGARQREAGGDHCGAGGNLQSLHRPVSSAVSTVGSASPASNGVFVGESGVILHVVGGIEGAVLGAVRASPKRRNRLLVRPQPRLARLPQCASKPKAAATRASRRRWRFARRSRSTSPGGRSKRSPRARALAGAHRAGLRRRALARTPHRSPDARGSRHPRGEASSPWT